MTSGTPPRHLPHPAVHPPAWLTSALTGPWRSWGRRYWVELVWVLFVAVNAAGILVFRDWATVPFHFIWIGLSLLYGWRVWNVTGTMVALVSVVVVTGVPLVEDVLLERQAPDELTEIPLMASVFVVMVWYVRRALAAREQIHQVSEHNLALLHRQRQFVQDASHILRTPLTIALGHAELVRRTMPDADRRQDLDVVIDELSRLKRISDRLLALAETDQPDFLNTVDTAVDELVAQAWSRWAATHPAIALGPLAPVTVLLDREHARNALDELVSNAVRHTPDGTPITLSVTRADGGVAVSVADAGPGIPAEAQARVFDRFSRVRQRDARGGHGLGLALVTAIAQAHGGRLTLHSEPGTGSTFSLWLPVGTSGVVAVNAAGGSNDTGNGGSPVAVRVHAAGR